VFTRNRVKAAPVLWSEQVLADGQLRAVILNSGGANACTGPDGFAERIGPPSWSPTRCRAAVGVQGGRPPLDKSAPSTSPSARPDWIGLRLPMDKISAGITELVPH
jgi:glutamate N-acetyltransferase/amino-acid N-acetyltransferase